MDIRVRFQERWRTMETNEPQMRIVLLCCDEVDEEFDGDSDASERKVKVITRKRTSRCEVLCVTAYIYDEICDSECNERDMN